MMIDFSVGSKNHGNETHPELVCLVGVNTDTDGDCQRHSHHNPQIQPSFPNVRPIDRLPVSHLLLFLVNHVGVSINVSSSSSFTYSLSSYLSLSISSMSSSSSPSLSLSTSFPLFLSSTPLSLPYSFTLPLSTSSSLS